MASVLRHCEGGHSTTVLGARSPYPYIARYIPCFLHVKERYDIIMLHRFLRAALRRYKLLHSLNIMSAEAHTGHSTLMGIVGEPRD